MRQFTFLCSVAEVNAVNSRARGKGAVAEPQLEFRRMLARQMMENTLDGAPEVEEEVVVERRRRRSARILQHTLRKRAIHEGQWDRVRGVFKRTTTDYVRDWFSSCAGQKGRKKFVSGINLRVCRIVPIHT